MKKTLYDFLEVSPQASSEIIEAAYVRLTKKYEQTTDDEAVNHLKIMHEAFQILSNAAQRTAYDEKLLAEQIHQDSSDFQYVIEDEKPSLIQKLDDIWQEHKSMIVGGLVLSLLILAIMVNVQDRDRQRVAQLNRLVEEEKAKNNQAQAALVRQEEERVRIQDQLERTRIQQEENQRREHQAQLRQYDAEKRSEEYQQRKELNLNTRSLSSSSQSINRNEDREQWQARAQQKSEERAAKERAANDRKQLINQLISNRQYDLARSYARTTEEMKLIERSEHSANNPSSRRVYIYQ